MTRLVPAQPLEEILERDWQRDVVKLATQLGWLSFHTYNARRSTHGFPDLVLVRNRVIFLELKRENRTTSKLTDEQRHWLGKLAEAGAEVYVVRPSHAQQLARVLSSQGLHLVHPGQGLRLELDRELGRSTA